MFDAGHGRQVGQPHQASEISTSSKPTADSFLANAAGSGQASGR
jgi:hypothetical protein